MEYCLVENKTKMLPLLVLWAEGEPMLLYLPFLSVGTRELVWLLTCASLGGIPRLCFQTSMYLQGRRDDRDYYKSSKELQQTSLSEPAQRQCSALLLQIHGVHASLGMWQARVLPMGCPVLSNLFSFSFNMS